jgi:hypothetical protein
VGCHTVMIGLAAFCSQTKNPAKRGRVYLFGTSGRNDDKSLGGSCHLLRKRIAVLCVQIAYAISRTAVAVLAAP